VGVWFEEGRARISERSAITLPYARKHIDWKTVRRVGAIAGIAPAMDARRKKEVPVAGKR